MTGMENLKKKKKKQDTQPHWECKLDPRVQETTHSFNDENKQAF